MKSLAPIFTACASFATGVAGTALSWGIPVTLAAGVTAGFLTGTFADSVFGEMSEFRERSDYRERPRQAQQSFSPQLA